MTINAPTYTYTSQSIAVIGYGVTGKACAEYLLAKGANVTIFDKKIDASLNSSHLFSIVQIHENIDLSLFSLVVVSPGVNLQQPFLQRYMHINAKRDVDGPSVIGDIELFARELNAQNALLSPSTEPTKVIAVTGSNGKSTVVDMLTKALTEQGLAVALGGNFGTSALSLLRLNKAQQMSNHTVPHLDVIVLELSSFQLESTFSLCPYIACILNVTSDHIDRHGSMFAYTQAKQQIYLNAQHTIYNRDDTATLPPTLVNSMSIGLTAQGVSPSIVLSQNQQGIFAGHELVLNATKFANVSEFQLLNMQAVLACGFILQLDIPQVVESLTRYKGLAHRFEIVYENADVRWINDSKATNPGACVAAINSLAQQLDHIVLIAGGDAKGADTDSLARPIQEHVKKLILIGKDAHLFTQFSTPYVHASSIQEAVKLAKLAVDEILSAHASGARSEPNKPFIGVLLSPACASIDMFTNYAQRGLLFCQAVHSEVGE